MNHRTMTLAALATSMVVGSMVAGTAAMAQGMEKPAPSPHAPTNPAIKSPDAITWGQLSKGRNSFTQDEAKARLEKAGYTHVAQLKLDKDGLWQASANSGGKPVRVALDYKGNVAHR